MNQRDIDTIQKFVTNQGVTDLFAYFGLSRSADIAAVDAAVRSKRAWAQGQQANPKYRETAIWLIKNVSLCKRALGAERSAYIGHITKAAQSGALEVLGNVLDGAVYDHKLSLEREEAVLDRGVQLGLPDTVVEQYIEDYLDRHEARRQSPPDFIDLYELLGLEPDASASTIEQAVRRSLAKSQGHGSAATKMRRNIRRAARLFRSPELRAEYDAEREREVAAVPGLAAPNEREQQLTPQHTRSIQLRLSEDDSDVDTATTGRLSLASAPPAPPSLGGRTLPSGQTTGSIRRPGGGPRFEIVGESQVTIRVGRAPATAEFTVRAVGDYRLSGRILSDRTWLSISPERLDPTLSEQTITLTIDPEGLTRSRAVALCTVIADRGSRKSVTVVAERRGIKPQWLAAAAIIALGFGTAAAWPSISATILPPPPPPPPSATLSVLADPPVGEVHINGKLRSAGGTVRDVSGLPVNKPIEVRIITDGFQVWEETVALKDGESRTLKPELTLTDPMDYVPDAEAIQGTMNASTVSRIIRSRETAIQKCIVDHHPADDRIDRRLEIVSYVLADGHIGNLSFEGTDLPSADAVHCIKRQLRSLHLPLLQGHYGISREWFIVSFPNTEPEKK